MSNDHSSSGRTGESQRHDDPYRYSNQANCFGGKKPRARRGKPVTNVLLIDDHPIVLQGCKKLLENAGADEVSEAQWASEGFQL